MQLLDPKRVCLIPARQGSKRIPGKNILQFNGKPMLRWAVETAVDSGLFEKIIVSTDCQDIAQIAIDSGASVPFIRPAACSNDFATDDDVRTHFINWLHSKDIRFDMLCYMYPTSVFLTQEVLLKTCKLLEQSTEATMSIPLAKFRNSIYRSFDIDRSGNAFFRYPEFAYQRSQDLPEAYFDSGQCYWFNLHKYDEPRKMVPFVIDSIYAQDIDTLADLQIADLLFKALDPKKCFNGG